MARYGPEENHPVYDPVIPKWDGKEGLAVAHTRMAKDAEMIDIDGLEVIVPGVDIVEANYVPPKSARKRKGTEIEEIDPKKVCVAVDAGLRVDDSVTVDDVTVDDDGTVDGDGTVDDYGTVDDDGTMDDFGTVDGDGTVGDAGTVDDEDDGESIVLEDDIVQNESQENEPVQDKTRADEKDEVLDTIELSKGWIKSVIFDREWKEPTAKVQLISRVRVNNLIFLRIYDGSDNTGQCCVDEEAVISWLAFIPDNSVLEVMKACLENGSRIVLKKVRSLKILENPHSDNL